MNDALGTSSEAEQHEHLPDGWARARLGDVLPLSYGKGLTAKRRNTEGSVPVYGSSGIVGHHDAAITNGPTIIVGRKGTAGAVHYSDVPCWPIDTVYFAEPSKGLEPRLFAHLLRHLNLGTLDQSTAIPSLSRDNYDPISVALPPAAEQERIVSKIEELFSQIDAGEANLRRVQALVKTYRQSVLKAAVTGELTHDWREKNAGKHETGADLLKRILEARRQAWEAAELAKMKAKGKPPKGDKWKAKHKEPEPPDTSNLPELPEGWAWATLPQFGEFGRGKSKHRPRNDPKLYGGPYPFLQTGTIRRSQGRITDYDSTYNETGLAQSKLWPKGTICITIAANIAESGILEFAACFPDSVVGLFPVREVEAEYIECFIRTAREDLDRYAPATAQKNINLEILSQVAVPLPPQAEQQKINEQTQILLSNATAVESELENSLLQSNALRQAVLRAAFSGQLIPQNPDDEPASELLKRIAAERVKREIAKPRKPRGRRGRKPRKRAEKSRQGTPL